MFGHEFFNESTRRYIAAFGTIFNDIIITRSADGGITQKFKVPLSYGPHQKFLAKIEQDKDLSNPAITLPRMSFEMSSLAYDPTRKLSRNSILLSNIENVSDSRNTHFAPTPYNIEMELKVMTKHQSDGHKVIEQILPFFTPEFTITANILKGFDHTVDTPIILNSVSIEDTYEGSFEERRALIWTLSFTIKAVFFGPVTTRKIIKFVETDLHSSMSSNTPSSTVTVQPGLTTDGNPTTDIDQTISYLDINEDDDWAFIVQTEGD